MFQMFQFEYIHVSLLATPPIILIGSRVTVCKFVINQSSPSRSDLDPDQYSIWLKVVLALVGSNSIVGGRSFY